MIKSTRFADISFLLQFAKRTGNVHSALLYFSEFVSRVSKGQVLVIYRGVLHCILSGFRTAAVRAKYESVCQLCGSRWNISGSRPLRA